MVNTKEIFDSETRKNNGQMHYPLDRIYYALVNGYECIVYEMIVKHKSRYIELLTIPDFRYIDIILNNNFKIIKSLKEEIDSKKINVCLLSKDGKEKRELTIDEIINIIKLTNLLDNKSFDNLNGVCISMANQISDLLGINVISNPSSILKLRNIEEIAIPATKALKFKNVLFNYIKISMILDGSVTISNDDYRILRALKGCKIKTPVSDNEFKITASSNGEVILECSNVVEGFQKPFRNKKISI